MLRFLKRSETAAVVFSPEGGLGGD